jgi:hydroxymethylpyrimidine/phosphomethylpyrimidine kinase
MNRTLLTVSGFDSSGATGVAADLKTFQTFRVYGTAAVTAIAAQNSTSVQALHAVPMEVVGQQVEAIASDIKVHGIKTGILATAGNVQIVASLIEAFALKDCFVLDPVLQAATGEPMLEEAGIEALRSRLLPLALVVTPNRYEAEILSGIPVQDVPSAKEAARLIQKMGPRHVVVTGGGFPGPRATDIWYDGQAYHLFDAPRPATPNVLGIGHTFSAALCALLAKGCLMGESIDRVKKYIGKAIQHPFQIGKGKGPLNHTVPM